MGQIIVLKNADFSADALPFNEIYDNIFSEVRGSISVGYANQYVLDHEMPACIIVGIMAHIPSNSAYGGRTALIGTRVFNNGSQEMKRSVEVALDLTKTGDQFIKFDTPLIVEQGDYLAIGVGSTVIDADRSATACMCYSSLEDAPYRLMKSAQFAQGSKVYEGTTYTFYNTFYGYLNE